MDGNNWRAAQGQVQMPGQVIGGEPVPAGGMEGGDWRTQLQQDSRRRIVYKIMETLKRHLPYSGQEGLQVLKEIAVRFEEKIYTAATSQSEYLRKISLKMLTMETKYQNPMANSLQSNAASNSRYPQDPASQNMQSQIQNQVQQLPIPMVSNQSQVRQTLLFQNIQNNIPSTGVPNSAGLTTALPAVGGMSQGTMSNVPVHNPNMQNMTNNVTTNAGGKSMGQGVPANMYANSQRQIQEQIAPPIVKISLVGGGDWRTQLQQHSRQRIVSKIMETLKRHLPYSGQEGMQELKKIAVRFEEKIYTAATSQSDYLRKISLKMLTMDVKSENPMVKSSSV